MRDVAILRLHNGALVWYPPGSSSGARPLDSDTAVKELQDHIVGRRRLWFAVPGTDVQLLRQTVAPAERRHLARSLPYLVEERLAQDVDELQVAAIAADASAFAVAVCRHADMQHWQTLLEDVPQAVAWVPEPLLLPWQPGEWCLLLEGDRALLRSGEHSGFAVETALLAAFLESAQREAGGPPERLIVYGEQQAADLAQLPEALRERAQWRAGEFSAALMLSEESAAPVNLLQGSYAPRLPLERWWGQWKLVAGVVLGAFLLQLAATYSDYRALQSRNLVLRGDMEQQFRQVFPQGRMQDPEKQLQRRLASLQGTTRSAGFSSLIYSVGAAVASQPGTSIANISYNERGGDMRLNLLAKDFAAVEAIRTAMSDSGLEAILESSNAQDNAVRARLRVRAG